MVYYRFWYSKDEYEDMTLKQVRRQLEIQDAFLITYIFDDEDEENKNKETIQDRD